MNSCIMTQNLSGEVAMTKSVELVHSIQTGCVLMLFAKQLPLMDFIVMESFYNTTAALFMIYY